MRTDSRKASTLSSLFVLLLHGFPTDLRGLEAAALSACASAISERSRRTLQILHVQRMTA